MALFQPVRMQRRPPYIGRAAIVSPYRGILRVQGWPRKRGIPKRPRDRARLEIFSLLQKAQKHLQGKETEYTREAINEHNRTHRGQRGSAAIRQRDWHHQRLAGRGFAFDLDDGRTIYPPGVRRTASHLLNHIDDRPTSIASRQSDEWIGTRPTAPGQVFKMNATGDGAEWNTL